MRRSGENLTVLPAGEGTIMTDSAATPSAYSTFGDLAQTLADNFVTNSSLGGRPASQVIVVLGSSASASESTPLPSWTDDLKHEILDLVGGFFQPKEIFLEEICRVFGSQLGHYLWKRQNMYDAIVKELRVEQISNVACQMLGHADLLVRKLISNQYRALIDDEVGPPPNLTYELLAHFTKHGFINHIITMNFDEMLDTALENELGPGGFDRIITGHEPVGSHDRTTPRLFKVHGTASSPESLRFTYTEVAVLTSAQAKHLKALLEGISAEGCDCLNLISFGYSWQDPDLAHWVFAHWERFNKIYIVRRGAELPKIFADQLEALEKSAPGSTAADRFKVLSIAGLSGGNEKSVQSSTFWWALMEAVWDRLPGEALIPFARHLLLGNILAEPARRSVHKPLPRRVRLEILLHLLKSKGMVNTFGAPASPRIRAYFARLRLALEGRVVVDDFLNDLGLGDRMERSREPQARDTFFAKAESVEDLIEDVTSDLAREAPAWIRQPHFQDEVLAERKVEPRAFIREQVEKIVAAPEIEISREVNDKLYWSFSSLEPVRSFPQFVYALREILGGRWTHLLAIVESRRWLDFSWTEDLVSSAQGKSILMILPSFEGLNGWKVGRAIRSEPSKVASAAKCIELEIPWWRHNRHLFLPVCLEDGRASLGPGLFFIREHKSPAVAPVYLQDPRDQAKLLATFLFYTLRSTTQSVHEMTPVLCHLVGELIAKKGIHPDMLELVQKAYDAIGCPGQRQAAVD